MIQRMITERFDGLDGSPAVETVLFGYAGREYEIDLRYVPVGPDASSILPSR